MTDVYVYIVRLPDRVHEMVLPCGSGYTVYLDDRLSPAGRRRAYSHALRHIRRGDMEQRQDKSADKIEKDIRKEEEE